jgi:predicted nucleotidyltransferase
MESLGETIKKLREKSKLPLRTVAAFLDIDQAVLSKIERGQRKATREHIVKLAGFFNVPENELLIAWLSDKLLYDVAGENLAMNALQVAEEKVAYHIFQKTDRKKIIRQIKEIIGSFSHVEKAWIYGSFAREDDNPSSDIDIAFKSDNTFTYFDLAEIQYRLEKIINRKVDVGFIDSFKPHIFENVKNDLKLIYER